MSKQLPIFIYPSGQPISPPIENVTYKWIDQLGGGILPGPIPFGTIRPDGLPGHGGVATVKNGHMTVEYHHASAPKYW
jgi:hypothetical protein